MAQEPGTGQALSLEGEVVEILEKGGQRLAKIMLRPRTVLAVAAGEVVDVHLGDRVVISGLLTVETLSPATGLEPGDRAAASLDTGPKPRAAREPSSAMTTEPRQEEEHT